MKKTAIAMSIIALIMVIVVFVWVIPNATNKQILDFTFSFEHAVIALPDGKIIGGEVASWKDFDDGDQIQVKFKTGETYLTHISNVCLISE